MKKLFICFALMFFFAFPLGSANTNSENETKFCSECGGEISASARFCTECGADQ